MESNLQLQNRNKFSPLHLYTPSHGSEDHRKGKGKGEQKQQEAKRIQANFSSVSGGDLRCAGKMAPAKSGERASSFAMACSLLSRYVRENGAAAGELGLGIRAEADVQRTPADGDKGAARKEAMDLFPQNAGFGSEAAVQEGPDAREQEKRQLTIFYGGKVLVFNDFPAEKAKDLMQLASKGTSAAQNSGLLPSSTTATVTDSTKVTSLPAQPNAVINSQKNAADIPQAPKASLRRFLEKRKDRLSATAPYQGSPSDATPVKKETPESQPWLGLGPQIANPDLSLRQECNQ
ncbi:protein TIFY 10a-like [Phragmites australis]|uniref:protein TIFY 10a-like n=1 Tax=Phragmites australis TaxID=29695 RepID=UPI002D7A287F|nr:protein TIFY 10a-like [Phragmites australis]